MSDALDLGDGARVPRVPRWRWAAAALLLATLLAMPLWGPPLLSQLDFFRVRKVEILGARYTPAEEVFARLRLDSTRSVWDALAPLAARVRTHPLLTDAVVTRKLPGTIVVRLSERRPIGLVATGAGFRAVDERGVQLPLDLNRTPVDAPVIATARDETTVYHLLGVMQRDAPSLYARVSSIHPAGGGELLIQLAGLPVRTMTSVTLARLSEIEPVERDLARRQQRARELDLRYRDQVIARLP